VCPQEVSACPRSLCSFGRADIDLETYRRFIKILHFGKKRMSRAIVDKHHHYHHHHHHHHYCDEPVPRFSISSFAPSSANVVLSSPFSTHAPPPPPPAAAPYHHGYPYPFQHTQRAMANMSVHPLVHPVPPRLYLRGPPPPPPPTISTP